MLGAAIVLRMIIIVVVVVVVVIVVIAVTFDDDDDDDDDDNAARVTGNLGGITPSLGGSGASATSATAIDDAANLPTVLIEYPIVCLDARRGLYGCVKSDAELGCVRTLGNIGSDVDVDVDLDVDLESTYLFALPEAADFCGDVPTTTTTTTTTTTMMMMLMMTHGDDRVPVCSAGAGVCAVCVLCVGAWWGVDHAVATATTVPVLSLPRHASGASTTMP